MLTLTHYIALLIKFIRGEIDKIVHLKCHFLSYRVLFRVPFLGLPQNPFLGLQQENDGQPSLNSGQNGGYFI